MNDQIYSEYDYVPFVNTDTGQSSLGSDADQQPGTSYFQFTPEAGTVSDRNSQYLKAKSLQRRFCHMFTTQKFCEWLKHEWLYSTVDREIFLGSNDFQLILREHFPSVKTRRMCRGHWAIVRRIIGRPRRFSPTFLAEERGSVQGKRRNLNYLQHLTLTGSLGPMASEHLGTLLTCLPANTRVPQRLPVGTKVCLSLYTPLQGLYLGVIQDACPGDGHYAVWVEELVLCNGLANPSNLAAHQPNNFRGYRIVPDEDVFPLPHQSLPSHIPLSTLRYHFKENLMDNTEPHMAADYRVNGIYRPPRLCDTTNTRSDYENPMSTSGGPLLSESICTAECTLESNGSADLTVEGLLMSTAKSDASSTIPGCSADSTNSFPTLDPHNSPKLFASLAKLFKLMKEKQLSIETLKEMNDTAEVKLAENPNNITVQFQHTYATLILHLDKLNQELKHHMDIVLMHVAALSTHNIPYLLSTHTGEVFEALPLAAVPSEFGYITLVPNSVINQRLSSGVVDATIAAYPTETRPLDCDPSQDKAAASMLNDFCLSAVPPHSYDDPRLTGFGQLAQEQNMMHFNYITDWRRRCDDEAQEMVNRIKLSQQRSTVDECKLDLVAKLSSLLIHLCNLSDHRMLGQTLACVEDLLKEIRLGLHPSNVKCFEVTVEHFIGQIVNAVTSSYHARSVQNAAYAPNTLVSYPHSENASCI